MTLTDSGYHVPVMPEETIEALGINPEGVYIDGTAGGGGHSEKIAQRLSGGRLFCIDRDLDAVGLLRERFSEIQSVTVLHGNYSAMRELLAAQGITAADGILLDIGVSSHQLDEAGRGFSFHTNAPLDMRMDRSGGITAAEIVNTFSQQELREIFFKYGEERFSSKISQGIIKYRQTKKIETTGELSDIIKEAYPAAARRKSHPARQVFQALRIVVNDELGELEKGLEVAFSLLVSGGRLCVITFHSLEDRMVKNAFRRWCTGCVCPPEFPVCVCGKTPRGKLAFKKPIEPSAQELLENNRARSSKLRCVIKN